MKDNNIDNGYLSLLLQSMLLGTYLEYASQSRLSQHQIYIWKNSIYIIKSRHEYAVSIYDLQHPNPDNISINFDE